MIWIDIATIIITAGMLLTTDVFVVKAISAKILNDAIAIFLIESGDSELHPVFRLIGFSAIVISTMLLMLFLISQAHRTKGRSDGR